MQIKTFAQFEKFLHSRIPTREALFMGDLGLKRAEYFMELLGNPQNKLKVVHIAGTSGKGSTAHIMSHILQSQGFSVGLSISPHVLDIRERMQINNKLLNKKTVLKYFNEILPTILKMEKCKYGMPTFFEINVALAYYMFAKENLNYAVMETGLGGTLDATNTVSKKDKICIITKLGLDHTEILGNTLPKIAKQKAGIIQNRNAVISNRSSVITNRVIEKQCRNKNAKLYFIDKNNFKIISHSPQKTVFYFTFSVPCHPEFISGSSSVKNKIPKQVRNDKNVEITINNINLGLIGRHQAENCSLALACLQLLSKRDGFAINETTLRKSLENIHIPGRFEMRNINNKTVIIDGAHNPQKMRALVKNLAEIYPKQKFTFIIAFKKSKDYKKMLLEIFPLAEKIYLARFSTKNMDGYWSSVDNKLIAEFLKSQDFHNFSITKKATDHLLAFPASTAGGCRNPECPIVITGSLYLVGDVHKHLRTIERFNLLSSLCLDQD